MGENTQGIQQAAQSDVNMDDFDAGFNDGITVGVAEGEASTATAATAATAATGESSEQAMPEQPTPEQALRAQAPADPTQALPAQAAMHQLPAPEQIQQPATGSTAGHAQAALVEISAEIADEFAELERLSPTAAALAREDSPEGAAIRDRLERVGADSAFDRAEVLLERRERAAQAATAQQQAIEAHNRNFQHVLRSEHPEIFAPDRTPEQNQRFMADMKTWIEAKPYGEARGLMEIYEGGRDPRQVAALLTRFKQEVGASGTSGEYGTSGAYGESGAGKKHTVDPTAMMAVAGRGAPIVPKTVGGKDDFYAGFTIDE